MAHVNDKSRSWSETPPWSDPLFCEDDIKKIIQKSLPEDPHGPVNYREFASELNDCFRELYELYALIMRERPMADREQKALAGKINKAANALLELIGPPPASVSLNPLNLSPALRRMWYLTSDESLLHSGSPDGGIDLPSDLLVALTNLEGLNKCLDSALPPRLADAVLEQRVEECSLTIWPGLHEGARRDAVAIFLLAATPGIVQKLSSVILKSLSLRSELVDKVLGANGKHVKSIVQYELYEKLVAIFGHMWPNGEIAKSSAKRYNNSRQSNRWILVVFFIVSKKFSSLNSEPSEFSDVILDICSNNPATISTYFYNTSRGVRW